ncbi:MAG: UbiD family decarboxylase, partial [Casimicrobiaceae bacterium]
MSTSLYPSMRAWLAHLAATDRVAVMRDGIRLEFELAAIAKRLDGEKATFFPHPDGHAIPVISGFMSRRSWIAETLGVAESDLPQRMLDALANPLPWREVTAGAAPVQEVAHDGVDIRRLLPIPKHNEHDSAPYISAGLVIARNPRTGAQNVSINRIQVNAPDRMGMLILPRHLHAFQSAAEEAGEALPVAVVIGASPAALLASQAILPIDHDELTVAGALEGQPLDVVRCQTSEVRVPAQAEIVIEGRVLAGVREPEGPFGEFPKYYSPQQKREVIAIDRVTHRRNPIYHTIVPAAMEHLLLGAISREATMLAHLKRSFPNVTGVHLAVGGACRYHLYVQMRKTREGEPKNVIMDAFGGHYDIKHVVVVDEDVDVFDEQEVLWAIYTNVDPSRDVDVLKNQYNIFH